MIHATRCMMCAHLNIDDEESEKLTCDAFPEGIPEDKEYADFDDECNGDIKFTDME